ncbi:MAG: DUF5677 domain-containing protein, partial [Acidobacteriota bacterium]|nr:DUF5677 domain-containing protein [Acidobacteriota bacterium]
MLIYLVVEQCDGGDALQDELASHVDRIIGETVAKRSEELLEHCLTDKEALLYARRVQSAGFNERLYSRWAEGLDQYELSLIAASESGDYFNEHFRSKTAKDDYRPEVLYRLHGNALLVATEIYHLLLGGFASGAHGRCRTLHEIAVVMLFISGQPSSTAEA